MTRTRWTATWALLKVLVKPLDDVCDNYGHIAVLKADLDGNALHLLKDVTKLFPPADCNRLECWSVHKGGLGYKPDDLIALIPQTMALEKMLFLLQCSLPSLPCKYSAVIEHYRGS